MKRTSKLLKKLQNPLSISVSKIIVSENRNKLQSPPHIPLSVFSFSLSYIIVSATRDVL